jgi:glycosyltransferase involved in cell wall biosynthesis
MAWRNSSFPNVKSNAKANGNVAAVDLIARPVGVRSGVGRYAAALGRELIALGVDARLTPTIGSALSPLLESARRRHGIDLRSFLASYPLYVPTRRGVLVHITAQTFASMLWLQPGAVVTVHDLFPDNQATGNRAIVTRLVDAAARLALRRAAAVLTGSEATAAICRARGLVGSLGVTATSYGVDHALFRRQAVPASYGASVGLHVDTPILLYVGTEAPRKRVDVLIHLLARLRHGNFPDLLLVKVGAPIDPGRREELRALATALDVAKAVLWLDGVTEQELAWLYNRATLYVSAAEREGFGLPVLEAMASGCAVAVSDLPAHREVVGDAGLLVQRGDLAAWQVAVEAILRDREQRRSLGERGEERAALFTWRRTAETTLRVYERLWRG